jgi:YQGE family putative transporter
MSNTKLHPKATVAFVLTGLYSAAEALCSIFVTVYFWINSHDLNLICRYYIALFVVTPVFYILAGWYSQARDRLHVYRLGLVLHAAYYGVLLVVQERAPDYAVALGAMLGVTWGAYWGAANTINYDVTTHGKRERFYGLLGAVTNLARLAAPPIGGLIIQMSEDRLQGYHRLFALVLGLYLLAFFLSYRLPKDDERRPFRIRRALFPGRDQRDWRYVMLASMSLAGSFHIFGILLGLLMYLETNNEVNVGGFASYQALVAIAVSTFLSRYMRTENRGGYMLAAAILLFAAGFLFFTEITALTLILFGLLRSVSMSAFGIGHFSLRMEIIGNSAEEPSQRIEYLCAFEIPLAIGRILMLLCLMYFSSYFAEDGIGIRITMFLLCTLRLITYGLLAQTSPLKHPAIRTAF